MEYRVGPLPYLIAISLMWGSAYLFLKISSAEVPPLLLAALRAGVAVPVLLVICFLRREFTIGRARARDMLVIGTLNGWLPNALAALAITSISSAMAGVLQATTPIITGVLAAMLLQGERLSLKTGLCLAGGFAGVVLVVASSGGEEASGSFLGYLLMIGVAMSFGAGAVYARWAKPGAPALVASGQLVVAAVVAGVFSLLVGENWAITLNGEALFAVFMLGAFSTALPAMLFLVVISRYKAVKVGAASFLQPIWAILLGFLRSRVSGGLEGCSGGSWSVAKAGSHR
ncbi:MAG: DMT family transporter [Pseudomonadota bacterium]